MASSKSIPCGPCRKRRANNKAIIWCNNCDEGLCQTCSGQHKRSQLSRDHKTIDIKIHKPSIHPTTTECEKHGQQLNLYCPAHLMPCCDKCISISHSKCTGIKSLAGVVEKTKIEKSKESLDKDISYAFHVLNEMVNNKLGNIKRGEQQYENIKETIAKFRKRINNHLDKLEDKLYQEIVTTLNQEKSKASNLITDIEGKKVNLNEMKNQLHTVTAHSSKLYSFLEVHKIEKQVHQCQRYVEDLERDERAKTFDIKIKKNFEIDLTLNKLGSLESLGEVTVVKTEMTVNRETNVKREAQVQSREQSNISNLTINIETKIRINIESWMRDMICLMDGRVLVVEWYGKVYLFTPDCILEKQLSISGKASSVTQINCDTIAFSYTDEKAVKIYNLENETDTKIIPLNKTCWGICFSNNCLFVGLSGFDEIRIIDLEGNTLKSIEVKTESQLDYLVSWNNRIIYSDGPGKTVYCVDESGKQIWQYKQDLLQPRGLCTDTFGNIFVADKGSSEIIVISKNGQDSKVLISGKDGVIMPLCICFKHTESSGFICNAVGKYLLKVNFCCG